MAALDENRVYFSGLSGSDTTSTDSIGKKFDTVSKDPGELCAVETRWVIGKWNERRIGQQTGGLEVVVPSKSRSTADTDQKTGQATC